MKTLKRFLKIIGSIFLGFVFLVIITPAPENDVVLETETEPVQSTPSVIHKKIQTATETQDVPITDLDKKDSIETKKVVPNEKTLTQNTTDPLPHTEHVSPTQKYYTVSKVVDGDTIQIDLDGVKTTVRLIGVDTPETVHPSKPVECMGIEASNYAKSSLSSKAVIIETDDSQGERDKYGRLLGYVFIDGTNFNEALISNGYAYEYTYNTPYRYQDQFKAAQESARVNQQGLWADGACDDYEESRTTPPVTTGSPSGKWYTSSHHSAKYYYCEESDGWKGLSARYLRTYESESELIADFPDHKLHQDCT